MIHPGDIHERHGRRVVVTYAVSRPDGYEAVHWEDLPGSGASGGSFGPSAYWRFRDTWGAPVARMRFNGAHKLYRAERAERIALQRRVADLERRLEIRRRLWRFR